MYIRKLVTRRVKGQTYYQHRLYHSVRVGGKPKKVRLLNLGADYDLPQKDWKALCYGIESILKKRPSLDLELDEEHVREEAARLAQILTDHHADRLVAAGLVASTGKDSLVREVDFNEQRQYNTRSVGVEQLALWALDQVGLVELLTDLGLSASMRRAVVGQIVGRMAFPASDRETFRWLTEDSALGELTGTRYDTTSLQQLYRASDQLVAHRQAIEEHCYAATRSLFGLGPTVTLLDLTNTYLEGSGEGQENAQYNRSKEKRTDCPLITLALVLDGNGFVQRSRVYPGNVREFSTMQAMLQGLNAPKEAVVVMDRGIATEANVTWLRKQGYLYVVVSRSRRRVMDEEQAIRTQTRSGDTIALYEESLRGERYVYCRSEPRIRKEEAIVQRQMKGLERDLKAMHEGLSKPRTWKNLDHIHQRIGRLKTVYSGVAQHYIIDVLPDSEGKKATTIRWKLDPRAPSRITHPGIYCLRTNVLDMPADALWRTYMMLTDMEAAFRSLKSELGLRPVFHRKDKRSEGHLFITTLAYQMVHLIRYCLRQEADLHHRWTTLRNLFRLQTRSTRAVPTTDGTEVVHSRMTDDPTPDQARVYKALNCPPCRLGIKNIVVPTAR